MELMFDTTAHEEYKSYSCSDSFQSQSGAAAVNDDDEEEEEEDDNDSGTFHSSVICHLKLTLYLSFCFVS